VALSFGPALGPNSSRAALKALGQKSKVDFHGPYINDNNNNIKNNSKNKNNNINSNSFNNNDNN